MSRRPHVRCCRPLIAGQLEAQIGTHWLPGRRVGSVDWHRRALPPQRSGALAQEERILLLGALGMLLVSVGVGAGFGAGGPSGLALRAHVHSAALGWLTLAMLAVAWRMTEGVNGPPLRSSRSGAGVCWFTVATVTVFVVADAAGSAVAEAWAGIGALAGILACLAWLAVVNRRAPARWTVPRLAMAAGLVVLLAGVVVGAASAAAGAGGSWGAAGSLAAAHSAVLAVPFVVLAATSVLEWSAWPHPGPRPLSTAGLVQVGALALAAVAVIAGLLGHVLSLVEANIPLELGGIAIFLVRVGPRLLTAGWASSSRIWLVAGTVALAVDVGLFAHVVFEIGARRYVSIGMVPRWLLFAVDHVTFVAVGTTTLFGAIAIMAGQELRWPVADALATAGVVLGLAGTAAGIGVGSRAVEAAGGALLGVSVLAAVAMAAARVVGIRRQPES